MKMIKKSGLFLSLMLLPMLSFAQFNDATKKVEELKSFIVAAAPIAFLVSLLVGVIFNLGKVWGDQRDWKGFFTSVLMFVLAVTFVAAAVAYLLTLKFS